MIDILLAGMAMMLVFEGLLPLLAPQAWRDAMTRILALRDGQLRFIGLASILAGTVTLLMVI